MTPNVTTELNKVHTDVFKRANHLLDEIQRYILPWDSDAALQLLTEFIGHPALKNSQSLPEPCARQLLVRAVDLAIIAATEPPPTRRPKRSLIN